MKNSKEQVRHLSIEEMEKQENLSLAKLKTLSVEMTAKDEFGNNPDHHWTGRPRSSFLELMNWAEQKASPYLSKTDHLHRIINNRIIIDGLFSIFAEENKVKITCLHQDSILSWRTESNQEKYFIQGVFKISWGKFEIIHCALFHKGNQNEDEISFFVLVDDSSFEAYLELRNKFDDWVRDRDRSNNLIRVIDGNDINLTTTHTWEELFFPDELKNDIRNSVENFLSSKDFYAKHRIPWRFGTLLYGEAGVGKTSLIRTIISQYPFKAVTISPGANTDALREAFAYAEEQSPALLYLEDLDSMLAQHVDLSTFLNLMDGVEAKNGLYIIATANDVNALKASITSRPGRCDLVKLVPLPDEKMSKKYLKEYFGDMLKDDKIAGIAKTTVANGFSYAYLKNLYLASMFDAITKEKKIPSAADVDSVLKKILKDKNQVSGKSIDTKKYT